MSHLPTLPFENLTLHPNIHEVILSISFSICKELFKKCNSYDYNKKPNFCTGIFHARVIIVLKDNVQNITILFL